MKKLSKRGKKPLADVDKKECQKGHFINRIRRRLKITLTDNDIDQLVSCIKNQKNTDRYKIKYLEKQSNRVVVYELTIDDKEPVNILYDKFRHMIVTVLFKEDGDTIYHYYDIFGNKIKVKQEYGYSRFWKMIDGQLQI